MQTNSSRKYSFKEIHMASRDEKMGWVFLMTSICYLLHYHIMSDSIPCHIISHLFVTDLKDTISTVHSHMNNDIYVSK